MNSIAMACRTSKRLYGAGLPLVLRKIVACTSKEPGRNEIDIFRQLSAFLSSGTGVDKLKHVRSLDLKTVGIASHEQDRKRVVQLLRSCMPHLESLSLILTDAWDPEGLWRCLSLSSGQLKELKLFLWLPGCTHMKWMDNPIPPSVERMVTFVTTSTAQVVSEALFAKVERVPGLKWELHSTKGLPVVNISWKTFREALSKLRRLTTTGKQLIDNVAWLEKNNVPPLPVERRRKGSRSRGIVVAGSDRRLLEVACSSCAIYGWRIVGVEMEGWGAGDELRYTGPYLSDEMYDEPYLN